MRVITRITAFVIFLIVIGVIIFYFKGYFFKAFTTPPAASVASNQDDGYAKGDINKDGQVNAVDLQLIQASIGCNKDSACWNKIIAKTLSGDNPIYTSDLDLDGDGEVTTQDVNLAKQSQ